LLFACVEPGDTVVVAAPSFSLYALQAKALGARVVEVPLRAPSGEFRFALEELARAARDAKLVLLGSPNNPTGTTLSFEDAAQLPYNLSAATALIARTLLARPELVTARSNDVVRERERVRLGLRELGLTVHPSGANFLLFEQTLRPAGDLHAALFRRGVLIRN